MNTALDAAQLSVLIEAQLGCAQELATVLEAEREALLGNDIDALQAAGSRKSAAARQLQALCDRMAAETGVETSFAAIEALLSRLPGSAPVLERWRTFSALAADCNAANRANGALIDLREKEVRTILAAMQPDAPQVYGRNGGYGSLGRQSLPSQIISRA